MFAPIRPDEIPFDKRWRYHKIEKGHEVRGWTIGPQVVCVMHWNGKHSQPCHDATTGGRLTCRACEEKAAARKIGYVPLFSQARERIVIIVSNLICLKVEKLPHASPIIVRRSLIPKAPLVLSEWPNFECNTQQTQHCKKWEPADLQPWLLHLWQDDALRGYFAALRSATEQQSAKPTAPPVPTSDVDPATVRDDNVVSLKTPLIRRPRKDKTA